MDEPPNIAEPKPQPRRRWFQFSLWSLLTVLLALRGIQVLSDHFHWFPTVWMGLISLAGVGLLGILILLWRADSKSFLRSWFQYSLRTLLIVAMLAGFGFAWLRLKVREARQQQAAVESIQKVGGCVSYDYEHDARGNSIPGAQLPGPAWLHAQLGADVFRSVYDATFAFALKTEQHH